MTAEITQHVADTATEIRDAACVVLVDTCDTEPKLLLGRRHADQIFLPDKWVFPGGRVDDDDRRLATAFNADYHPAELAEGIKPFALAALRELAEETGLAIRSPQRSPNRDSEWRELATGRSFPAAHLLQPLARAITPPGRIRRYDTWFFLSYRDALDANEGQADGELLDLSWFTLSQARSLDLPNITRLVIDDIAHRLQQPQADFSALPFYWSEAGVFRRTLIDCRTSVPAP